MRSQITDSGQFIDFNLSINEYLNEMEVLPFDKIFNSLFIGDSESDMLAGQIVGIKTLKYKFSDDKSDNYENEKALDVIKKYFEKT